MLLSRYKNQFFFTLNETVDKFRYCLLPVLKQYRDVKFNVKFSTKMSFLNAYVENQHGRLYSRVDHDPNIQRYTLPYAIGDVKVAHSHWLRYALVRAVHYCTSVYDFNQERIYLEITYLANGYSLEYIEQRINHFYHHFDAQSLRYSLDQQVYDKFRFRLFNFISEQKYFCEKSVKLEKNNEQVRLGHGQPSVTLQCERFKIKDSLKNFFSIKNKNLNV